jgi:hypothetical protein
VTVESGCFAAAVERRRESPQVVDPPARRRRSRVRSKCEHPHSDDDPQTSHYPQPTEPRISVM